MRAPSHSPTVSSRQNIIALLGLLTIACGNTPKNTTSVTPEPGALEDKLEELNPSSTEPVNSTCAPAEKLEGLSVARTPEGVREKLDSIENYLEDNPYPVPSFVFSNKAIEYHKFSRDEKIKLLTSYCSEYRSAHEWELGEKIENILIQNTFLDKMSRSVTVSFPGIEDLEGPILRMNCDLKSTKNKKIRGIFQSKLPVILLKSSEDTSEEHLEGVGRHEGTHLLNSRRWKLNSKTVKKTHRADELFTQEEMKIWGIPACSPVNNAMFDEMAADGIQMLMSEPEDAIMEWADAKNNRTSNYRAKYHLLKHIFFERLNSETDLLLAIDQALESRKVDEVDIRSTGKLMFTLSQKGIERLKVLNEPAETGK